MFCLLMLMNSKAHFINRLIKVENLKNFKKRVDNEAQISYIIIPIEIVDIEFPMRISKKCRYALRAIFELALREPSQPVKIHELAGAQNIPPRFLEVILNELRHAGFVDSQRGNGGGYMLARDAKDLTVGEVIEYIQGPISVAPDAIGKTNRTSAFFGDYAFQQLWREVNTAISEACDIKTFAELVEFERAKRETCFPDYSI